MEESIPAENFPFPIPTGRGIFIPIITNSWTEGIIRGLERDRCSDGKRLAMACPYTSFEYSDLRLSKQKSQYFDESLKVKCPGKKYR